MLIRGRCKTTLFILYKLSSKAILFCPRRCWPKKTPTSALKALRSSVGEKPGEKHQLCREKGCHLFLRQPLFVWGMS